MTRTGGAATMHAELSTVRELLNETSLRIPSYQRPYSWGTGHIGQLVEDIRRFRTYGAYRIGTFILHENQELDGGEPGVMPESFLDVVDGQQRYLSFGIIAFTLSGLLAEEDATLGADLRELASGLTLPDRKDGRSTANLLANAAHVRTLITEWSVSERAEFAHFFLDDCSLVRLTVTDLDSAFQMFDSQNTRGRELYPTDLLKAYHLREYAQSSASENEVLATVQAWEAIPPQEINHLFGHLLFPVLRWTAGHRVPSRGFSSAEINTFKGIREGRDEQGRFPWAQPVLLAKAYVDEFTARNRLLVDRGVLEPLEFPFQLTLPVIDGEMFFHMVTHYVRLTRELGIGSTTGPDGPAPDDAARRRTNSRLDETIRLTRDAGDGSGDVYVRELFGCLLLAYADRFGTENVGKAADRLARHAYSLRVVLQRVQRGSMENHALGQHRRVPPSGQRNLFAFLAQARDPVDLARLPDLTWESLGTAGEGVSGTVKQIFGIDPQTSGASGANTAEPHPESTRSRG